jgi:hypothetical protein
MPISGSRRGVNFSPVVAMGEPAVARRRRYVLIWSQLEPTRRGCSSASGAPALMTVVGGMGLLLKNKEKEEMRKERVIGVVEGVESLKIKKKDVD